MSSDLTAKIKPFAGDPPSPGAGRALAAAESPASSASASPSARPTRLSVENGIARPVPQGILPDTSQE